MMPLTSICLATVMLSHPAAELRAIDSEGVSPPFAESVCGRSADSDLRAASSSDQEAELKRLLVDRWQALSQVVARLRSVDDPTPEMGPNLVESEIRLLNAELDICDALGQSITADQGDVPVLRPCDKADQRITLRERNAETRLDWWRMIRAWSETGRRGGEASIEARARAAYWDAEIGVLRECMQARKPVPRRASTGVYPPSPGRDWVKVHEPTIRKALATEMGVELARLLYDREIAVRQELAAVRALEDPAIRILELESQIQMKLYRSDLEICDALGLRVLPTDDDLLISLEVCDQRVERVAIRERMLEHRQKACARIAALAASGRRGGEAFRLTQAEAQSEAAKIDLLREQISSATHNQAKIVPPSDAAKLRELLAERRAALAQRVAALEAMDGNTFGWWVVVNAAKDELALAELDACETGDQRMQVRERIVAERKKFENFLKRLHDLGRAGGEKYFDARAERLLAEIELLRERMKPGK
jgi:hypothetical protein